VPSTIARIVAPRKLERLRYRRAVLARPAPPYVRTVYGLVTQPVIGQPFTAALGDSPSPGQIWLIEHLALELLNYVSGQVLASLFVGQRFIAGTNQGQGDSFDAGRTIVRVNASELVTVTWQPTQVITQLQGRITATVEQRDLAYRDTSWR
jgi:hypothetical protein